MREAVDSLRLTPDEEARAGDRATSVLIARRLLVAAQHLSALLDQRLRPMGLTTRQATLLTVCRDLDGPTLARAANAMGCSHQNIRQLADALGRKGLLRQDQDPRDGRARRLVVTAAGKVAFDDQDDSDFSAVSDWFSGLTADEQAGLADLLNRAGRGLAAARK
ncbi:MAG: winged helix DNA-binding protein [Caulobacter sp.]|nr:winged helix DNA-binding protein [Caulobacter sp.]